MKLPELKPTLNYDKPQIISEDDPHWFANCLTLPIAAELARRSNLFPKLVAEAAMLVATIKAHNIESVSCDNDGQQWCDCVHEQTDKLDDVLAEARQSEQEGGEHGN